MPVKTLFGTVLCLMAIGLFGCQGQGSCVRGQWCDCSGGSECYQGCAGDGNGCRIFCHDMDRCGSTCGDACTLQCYNNTHDCSAECGTLCNISCNDSAACGVSCGPNCNYTCFSTKTCGAKVGPGSLVSCTTVGNCVVECTGDCTVYCTDEVDHCDVTCPGGASPVSCTDGRLVCGSC